MHFSRLASFLACAAGAALATGCGSSTTNLSGPPPTSVTATSTLPAANVALAFPVFAGYAMSCLTPSGAPAGTTATITVSRIAQSGAPTALSATRGAATALAAKAQAAATATPTALLYARETFSAAFSTPSYPACTITLPSGVSTADLTLELFDTSTGKLIAAAAGGTASGSTVPFTFFTPGPWSIVAGRGYVYELVSGSGLDLSFSPNASGDTFTYAGTLSETFVRPPITITNAPTPNPNPESTQTLNAKVAIDVGVSTAAATNAGSVSTFTSSETDAFTSPAQTVTSTTAETLDYSAPSATGGVTVSETGAKTTTSSGVTTTTTIGAGNGLVDILPEVAGPIAPANTAARTIAEIDPSGQSSTQTFNADGSYAETITYPVTTTGTAGGAPLTSTATEASNGSGVYDVPILGVPGTSVVYGAPAGGEIPVTLTIAAALTTTGNTIVQHFTVPTWYPNRNAAPVLYAQTYRNDGGRSLPSSCAVPASLGATATNALVQQTTTVDTVFGEVETRTSTSYDAQGFGVVCMVLSDSTQQYYDFTGQTQFDFTFSGLNTPLQTTTISETLGLQSATVSGASAAAAARAGSSTFQTPLARATVARFDALVARERTVRHTAALARFQASVKLMKGSH